MSPRPRYLLLYRTQWLCRTNGSRLGWLALAASCGAPSSPPPASPTSSSVTHGTASSASSVDTSPTATTATTGDSGPATLREPTHEVVDPTVVITFHDYDDPLLRARFAPRPDGTHLLLASAGVDEAPVGTFFLEPPFDRGEHSVLDLWDGVSGLNDLTIDDVLSVWEVADQDGDGIDDLWLGHKLLAGPLLGQAHDPTGPSAVVLAELETNTQGSSIDGMVLAAGFDADDDGHGDVLVGHALGGDPHIVHYGPLSGTVPSGRTGAHPEATVLGVTGCGLLYGYTFLPDAFGPGLHGFATGSGDPVGGCHSSDQQVYALHHPRGTLAPDPVATYAWGSSELAPLPDLTGDGLPEVAYFSEHDGAGWAQASPLQGAVGQPPTAEVDVRHGYLTGLLGDVNGDGIKDMRGQWVYDEGRSVKVWLLSPHPQPIDLSNGLEAPGHWGTVHHADIDGDGLDDLVYRPRSNDDVLHLTTGADITAAWAAHQP